MYLDLVRVLGDDFAVAKANMEAYDEHLRYWRSHRSRIATLVMDLREFMYASAFQFLNSHSKSFGKNCLVLDVGCGAGSEMDEMMLKEGCNIAGLDVSREMALSLQNRTNTEEMWHDCHSIVGLAEHLPFRNEAFDIAITVHALHHCAEPEKVLNELSRVSKCVAIFEPNKRSFLHQLLRSLFERPNKRFSITGYSESIIEYHSEGFFHQDIKELLENNSKGEVQAVSVGIIPNRFPFPKIFIRPILFLERLIQHLPILKWQLRSLVIIAT